MWLLLAMLSAVSAAMVAIWGKMGVKDVDPAVATTVRAIVFVIILTLVTLTLGRFPQLAQIENRTMKFLILSGVAGAASWLFYFWALKLGEVDKVATIDRLSLVFVILLAALLLGEKLTLYKIIGGVLVVGGAILITLF